jgi:hypothetical protein
VAIEELDQVGDADAAMAARSAKGGDPSLVDPILDGAGIDLKELADLVRRQESIGVDFLLVHDFVVLAIFPDLVNATKVSRSDGKRQPNRHEIDAAAPRRKCSAHSTTINCST